MNEPIKQKIQRYVINRRQHPAWQLLAARSAPLVLACLKHLLTDNNDGIEFDSALRLLAELLEAQSDRDEFGLAAGDSLSQARKELRAWIKRGLVVEREGKLLATDALEEALEFVEKLDNRMMTSTASRLSLVQREIDNLESNLNPDPTIRAAHIKEQISQLQEQLKQVEAGEVKVLNEVEAGEGIREIYNLATSLRADFRRVEDSYRSADQALRQSILTDEQHRGHIVDRLLDGHDQLLDTAEGRVFHGFQQQLSRSTELDLMKHKLRAIVRHPIAEKALTRNQKNDLRWLIIRLVKESATVIRARARSEKDVKTFLKTGLAAEHHRVGTLLNSILQQALDIDWQNAKVRKQNSPIPPIAIANNNLPVVERLRFKSLESEEDIHLDLINHGSNLNDLDDDFWLSFDDLNRQGLVDDTLAFIQQSTDTVDMAMLADNLPPTHDLETLALWLSLAREVNAPVDEGKRQQIKLVDNDDLGLIFDLPTVALSAELIDGLDWEC
jgi:polyhydroxyalkanoate synthesis regulator phasin